MSAMDSILVAAQLVLAVVFAVAGVAKLFDRFGSQRALVDFGVPARAAVHLGLLLPLAEMGSALALVFRPTARWGAVAALVLLAAFIFGIARAMRRGEAPDCHCFGQVHSSPAGTSTLVRNLMLAAVAGLIVVQGPAPAIDGWFGDRSATELIAIALGVGLVGLALVAWRLRSDNATLRVDLAHAREHAAEPDFVAEGLPFGAEAPEFELSDLHGERHSMASLREPGRPVVLFFMTSDCGPCGALLPAVARWQQTLADRVTVAIIASGTLDQNQVFADQGVSAVLTDDGGKIFEEFGVRSTPTAIAVDASGHVASTVAGGLHMPEVVMRVVLRREAADSERSANGSGLNVLQVPSRTA
jgi:peroxiredoxin